MMEKPGGSGLASFWRLLRRALRLWPMLLLASCLASPGPLPTLVPTVEPLSGSPSTNQPVAAGSLATVPSTWTPEAGATVTTVNSRSTLEPTMTPSITPILPSRTPTPTPTATPTITPTVYRAPTLPPTNQLGPSKLGLHIIRNNDPGIMEFVRQARPAVMKGVGDLGFLREVKEVSPNTITVGRLTIPDQSYAGNPEQAARDFVSDQFAVYAANPYVDYWEGWNEPDPNLDRMSWYARFEQERVRLLAANGWRAAIGGFPAGVPELDEFLLFVPAIETALEHGGILTLHEGSFSEMDYLYGDPLPGYPAYPDRGSMSFRYRWFYREILEPAGLVIPLMISELAAGAHGGWLNFRDRWVEMGWGATGTEAYVNQLAWYDAGVRRDGYVIGFTIFTAGAIRGWHDYDVNSILANLTAYVRGQG